MSIDLPAHPRDRRTVAIEEWQASRLPVAVYPDGQTWVVVATAHDGTEIELPPEFIRDVAEHLDAMAPPECTRCDLLAADPDANPPRCHEHGPQNDRRWP